MKDNTPRLDNQLCFALYSASSALTAIYRPLLLKLDLTYPQFLVMMALWEQDNVPISELSEKTCLGNSTLTPLLTRLEQKELLKRNPGQHDERVKTITLTKVGLKLSNSAEKLTDTAFCATGLSKVQAASLIDLCKKIGEKTSQKA